MNCVVCGKELVGRQKKYCSPEHRALVHSSQEIPQPVAETPQFIGGGWVAIKRSFEFLREKNADGSDTGVGRPVDAGNNNELLVIGDSAYGHSVAVDLVNGMIALDWTKLGVQNGTIEIDPKIVFAICEETNIIGEYQHRFESEVAPDGGYTIDYQPMVWRPIWFKRNISTLPGPVIVVGAQTTLPKEYGERNIKKLISLFPDGRIGID